MDAAAEGESILQSEAVRMLTVLMSQDAADKAIAHLAAHPPTTNSARLLTPEIFQKTYSRYCSPSRYDTAPPLSLADCKILLKYLAVDRDVLIMNKQGEVSRLNVAPIGRAFLLMQRAGRSTRSQTHQRRKKRSPRLTRARSLSCPRSPESSSKSSFPSARSIRGC